MTLVSSLSCGTYPIPLYKLFRFYYYNYATIDSLLYLG